MRAAKRRFIITHAVLAAATAAFSPLRVVGLSSDIPSPRQQRQQQEEPKKQLILSPDAVIRQAASSISKAFVSDGINRQTIRLPLSEAMYSDKSEGFVADRAIGWQGGPQETLRYLSPIVKSLLKDVTLTDRMGGLVPRVLEQTLLDFDGSSLLTAENPAGALYDVQALLQPNTDSYYMDTIAAIEDEFSDTEGKAKRLFLLVNPAWRDRSSWGLLGGRRAQEMILDRYETTFALDQFIVRGRQVSLLKSGSSDGWEVYLSPIDGARDGVASFIGSFNARPVYKQIDALLPKR